MKSAGLKLLVMKCAVLGLGCNVSANTLKLLDMTISVLMVSCHIIYNNYTIVEVQCEFLAQGR